MAVLQRFKVIQIGDGMAAAVCGRLFADVGADVTCIAPEIDSALTAHLNHGKAVLDTVLNDELLADLSEYHLVICEGGPAALAKQGLDPTRLRAAAPDTVLVLISPYGQTGPDADLPASDLTLFCASGIARNLTGQVDDLSEAPIRPVGEQSAFIGGIAAACAGMNAALATTPALIDVSIQEALATLSMTELTKAGLGGAAWSRLRLTDGNGATVCILPAKDGYAAISPREDHQWTAWLEAMGNPEWGTDPRFARKQDRIENWDALHALMSDWSRQYGKQALADLAQQAHVPSFPLCEPSEHLNSAQSAHRQSFLSRNIRQADVKTVGNPFGLSFAPAVPPTPLPHSGTLPLAGIRVLDFSWVIAGPTATRYLAAMGAEVIKVEAPGRGDPGRASVLHTALGQAKQAIVLNMKHKDGIAIAQKLARKSDIIIENFASGVMDRLDLGAAQLQAENPKLIYISASGMGRTGPSAKAVAYGTLLQCFTGFAGLNRHPERPPRVGMAWLDPMCGLKLAFIAAAALWHRARNGSAARVDFSMIEAMLWTMAEPLLTAQLTGTVAPIGNRSDRYAPHGIFKCEGEDGWLGLTVDDDRTWRTLCRLIPPLQAYEGFDKTERFENETIISDALTNWFIDKNATESAHKLSKSGVAAAALSTTAVLAASPHLKTRGFWNSTADGELPGLPWQADFGRAIGPAPAHGADTETVLRDVLNLRQVEIDALRENGALG